MTPPWSDRDESLWAWVRKSFMLPAGRYVGRPVAAGATTHAVAFGRTEADTSYGCAVSPSWNTTAWVSGKTTTGCTLNFGTAAPGGATVDLLFYRA